MRRRKDIVVHLYRKVLVSLVAVVALGAVGAGSASAAAWHVGGSELVGSANLAEATGATGGFTLTYSSFGVEIKCTGLQAKEAKITAPEAGKVGSLVFSGCSVISGGACHLSGTEIASKPLKFTATTVSGGEEARLRIEPEKGSTFMTYTLTGTNCSLAGGQTVKGIARASLTTGQEERVEQQLVFHTGASELEPITLSGNAQLKLASGGAWSFH